MLEEALCGKGSPQAGFPYNGVHAALHGPQAGSPASRKRAASPGTVAAAKRPRPPQQQPGLAAGGSATWRHAALAAAATGSTGSAGMPRPQQQPHVQAAAPSLSWPSHPLLEEPLPPSQSPSSGMSPSELIGRVHAGPYLAGAARLRCPPPPAAAMPACFRTALTCPGQAPPAPLNPLFPLPHTPSGAAAPARHAGRACEPLTPAALGALRQLDPAAHDLHLRLLRFDDRLAELASRRGLLVRFVLQHSARNAGSGVQQVRHGGLCWAVPCARTSALTCYAGRPPCLPALGFGHVMIPWWAAAACTTRAAPPPTHARRRRRAAAAPPPPAGAAGSGGA